MMEPLQRVHGGVAPEVSVVLVVDDPVALGTATG